MSEDELWKQLTKEEKIKALSLLQEHKQKEKAVKLTDIPIDVLKIIIKYLGNDVISFHNFQITCKKIKSCAKSYYNFATRDNLNPWVFRLLNRANKNNEDKNMKLSIFTKTMEENARYITIGSYHLKDGKLSEEGCYVCEICKYTGLILDTHIKKNPRGYVFDKHPEDFFDGIHLIGVNDLKKLRPKYKERKDRYNKKYENATGYLKSMDSHDKKRLFISAFDENYFKRAKYS